MKQEYWNDLQSAAVSQNIREHNDERERGKAEKSTKRMKGIPK